MKKYIQLTPVIASLLLFLVATVTAQETTNGQSQEAPKQGETKSVEPSDQSDSKKSDGKEAEQEGEGKVKPSEKKSDQKRIRKRMRRIRRQRVLPRKHAPLLEIGSTPINLNRLASIQNNPTVLFRFSIRFWVQLTRLLFRSFRVRDKSLWGLWLMPMASCLPRRVSCGVN